MSRRTERIAVQIQEELARLLREDVTDPRIGLVTLTRVDVAPDLSHAIVYYSTLSTDDPEALQRTEEGLASAAAFLRRRAARVLPLRRMPELRFRYDPSLSLGSRTLSLLREIDEEREDAARDTPEPGADGEAG